MEITKQNKRYLIAATAFLLVGVIALTSSANLFQGKIKFKLGFCDLKPGGVSQVASWVPSIVVSDVPSVVVSEVTSLVVSNVPSGVPTSVPSSNPSIVVSQVPSVVPSLVASTVISQVPSTVVSKVISDVPCPPYPYPGDKYKGFWKTKWKFIHPEVPVVNELKR